MRTSNIAKLIGLLLLGCTAEHTIANDADTEQPMQVIARPVCVEMCEYSLACGQITQSELGNCLNRCETDCTRLEVSAPTLVDPVSGNTASAAGTIRSVSTCYLASECSLDKIPSCYPDFIGAQANIVEGKPEASLSGTMGMSNCSMREDALTCESTISQNRDKAEAWSVTCLRTDTAATEWTCSCVEYGVQVATVTGTAAEDDPAFLELCWSEEQLACFYKGDLNCGKNASGTGL